MGKLIVPHNLTVFRLDQENKTVAATEVTMEGTLITLKNIREKITQKHLSMGIVLKLLKLRIWMIHS